MKPTPEMDEPQKERMLKQHKRLQSDFRKRLREGLTELCGRKVPEHEVDGMINKVFVQNSRIVRYKYKGHTILERSFYARTDAYGNYIVEISYKEDGNEKP